MSSHQAPRPPGSVNGGSGPQKEEQKRAAVRLRLSSQTGEVWQLRPRDSRLIEAEVVNISEGGMLVEIALALEAQARVYCRVLLPKGPQVANLAEVVRAEEVRRSARWRVGLRFVGMPVARRDLLVRWIFAELAARKR